MAERRERHVAPPSRSAELERLRAERQRLSRIAAALADSPGGRILEVLAEHRAKLDRRYREALKAANREGR